jgi:hypothetical protein
MDGPVSLPIDATARGRRRLWKAETSLRWSRVTASFLRRDVAAASRQLAMSKHHHSKAIATLLKVFSPIAHPVAIELELRKPVLCFSAVEAQAESPPRGIDAPLSADEAQPGFAVFYVLTASLRDGLLIRGTWGLIGSDHLIGRFFQRDPGGDFDAAIREAHARILATPERSCLEIVSTGDVMVPAGNGYMWCTLSCPTSLDTHNQVLLWRGRSWVHRNMISAEEVATSKRLLTLQPGDVPLAKSLLHPLTLRRRSAA